MSDDANYVFKVKTHPDTPIISVQSPQQINATVVPPPQPPADKEYSLSIPDKSNISNAAPKFRVFAAKNTRVKGKFVNLTKNRVKFKKYYPSPKIVFKPGKFS